MHGVVAAWNVPIGLEHQEFVLLVLENLQHGNIFTPLVGHPGLQNGQQLDVGQKVVSALQTVDKDGDLA